MTIQTYLDRSWVRWNQKQTSRTHVKSPRPASPPKPNQAHPLAYYYNLIRCSYIIKCWYYYYPPPCLQAREACPGHPSWFLRSSQIWSCQFFCFKDPAGPATNSPRDPLSDNFALFFKALFFTTICTKKAPTGPPETHRNLKNLQKTWPLNAPAAELCKKAPSGRG